MFQGKHGGMSYKAKQNRPRPKEGWFIVKGTQEAIIEKELWDKVQIMIKDQTAPNHLKRESSVYWRVK